MLRKENAELKANIINNGSNVDVTELNSLRQQVETLKSENEALLSQLRLVLFSFLPMYSTYSSKVPIVQFLFHNLPHVPRIILIDKRALIYALRPSKHRPGNKQLIKRLGDVSPTIYDQEQLSNVLKENYKLL